MLEDLMYLENIREYIEDHNIVVTYKWLSREMSVPVNAAKQMLYAYVEQYPSVSVMYMISGITASEQKEFQILLVPDGELERMKEHFEDIFGLHIFSIQKSQLKDSGSLFAADYDTCVNKVEEYSRWSPIECPTRPEIQKSTTAPGVVSEVNKTRPSFPESTTKAPVVKKPQAPSPSFPEFSAQQGHTQAKGQVSTKKPAPSSQPKASSKKLSSKSKNKKPFFPPSDPPTKKVKSEAEEPVSKEDVKKESKESSPDDVSPEKVSDQVQDAMSSATTEQKRAHDRLQFLGDSDIDDGESDEEVVNKSKKQRSAKVTKKAKQTKARASVGSDEGGFTRGGNDDVKRKEAGVKKRKRIQEFSSDEEAVSDGNAGEAKEEEPATKKRKRIKKLVSKMYVNEDGEMVTEKVWESDSATDVSEEESMTAETAGHDLSPSANNNNKPVPNKDSPVSIKKERKKQSSLFMFMKK